MQGMMQDDGLKCPKCQSIKICKNGHKNGKQRFLCKDCRHQFVAFRTQIGYDDAFKQMCLKAYLNGKSFRQIERTYSVHHTTVISWVQQAGFDLSEMARLRSAEPALAEAVWQDQDPGSQSTSKADDALIRDAILASAMQVFVTQGYTATTLKEISARSGVSLAALSRCFKDKDTLFSALVQQLLNETHQNLRGLSTHDDPPATPDAVLRQVAIALLNAFSKDQTLSVLIRLLVCESGRFPELAKRFVSQIEKPIFDQLSTYLKFHPDVHMSDPLAATRMFVGSLMHYSLIQNVLQAPDPLSQEREHMIDGLVAGIMATAQ